MSNLLKYRAPSQISDAHSEIALYYRSIKKICRNCHAKLPIDSDKCRKCHNTDLRLKHKLRACNGGNGDYGLNELRTIDLKNVRNKFKKV